MKGAWRHFQDIAVPDIASYTTGVIFLNGRIRARPGYGGLVIVRAALAVRSTLHAKTVAGK